MFKEGDTVFSSQFKEVCRIKKISRDKCSVVFDKPVLGSTVKLTSLSLLRPAAKSYEKGEE